MNRRVQLISMNQRFITHPILHLPLLLCSISLLSFDVVSLFSILPSFADSGELLTSSYEIASLDANPLGFLFKYSPEAVKMLEETSGTSIQSASFSDISSWLVCVFQIFNLLTHIVTRQVFFLRFP